MSIWSIFVFLKYIYIVHQQGLRSNPNGHVSTFPRCSDQEDLLKSTVNKQVSPVSQSLAFKNNFLWIVASNPAVCYKGNGERAGSHDWLSLINEPLHFSNMAAFDCNDVYNRNAFFVWKANMIKSDTDSIFIKKKKNKEKKIMCIDS